MLGAVTRGLILGASAPLPPYPIGAPLYGSALGEVIDSARPRLQPGQRVRHRAGWPDIAWGEASGFTPLDEAVPLDPAAHLAPGSVAYVGLRAVADAGEGDTVLVTGTSAGDPAKGLTRRCQLKGQQQS